MPTKLEIALELLKVVDDNGEFDGFLAPGFAYHLMPNSLRPMAKEELNLEGFKAFLHGVRGMVKRFNFSAPLDTIIGKDVVVIHLKANGETHIPSIPFVNEYIMTFYFDANDKIVKLKEFMDSKSVVDTQTAYKKAVRGEHISA